VPACLAMRLPDRIESLRRICGLSTASSPQITVAAEVSIWPAVVVGLLLAALVSAFLAARKPISTGSSSPKATTSASAKAVEPYRKVTELEAASASLEKLLEDDQWVIAGKIVLRLQRTASASGALAVAAEAALARVHNADGIVHRYHEAAAALAMIAQDAGWKPMTSAADGTRTYIRREDGLIWTKTVARMPVPMVHALCVCREAELYKTWYPCCVDSSILVNVGETEMVFRIEDRYEMPLLTVCEDVIVHTFLVDCAEETGGLLACGHSPRQSAWPNTPFPPKPAGRYSVRTLMTALQFFCEPDGPTACSVTLQMAIKDPGAPEWLMSFIFSKVLSRLFGALGEAAQAISASPHTSPHAKAIRAKPRLYADLLPAKIQKCEAGQASKRTTGRAAGEGRAGTGENAFGGSGAGEPETLAGYMAETSERLEREKAPPRWLQCCLPNDKNRATANIF